VTSALCSNFRHYTRNACWSLRRMKRSCCCDERWTGMVAAGHGSMAFPQPHPSCGASGTSWSTFMGSIPGKAWSAPKPAVASWIRMPNWTLASYPPHGDAGGIVPAPWWRRKPHRTKGGTTARNWNGTLPNWIVWLPPWVSGINCSNSTSDKAAPKTSWKQLIAPSRCSPASRAVP
jgi:hypothetical protein